MLENGWYVGVVVQQVNRYVRTGWLSSLAESEGGSIWIPDHGVKPPNYKPKNVLMSQPFIM